ncbi:S-adenosyl-L-methionine-dependent methyltransferase [Phlebopus sp. FC_14]|nr:S-adenosyl-L-methionine-dependent methyltransferase [Phlebopus sp. FC_14]
MTEIRPSKLGTREHWDSVYEEELRNFDDNGDEGEIWFGEESVEKMVQWALQHVPPRPDLTVLEVGSGNGTLIFALVAAGYPPDQLSGIDYSEGAVELARRIANTRDKCEDVTFNQCDFLHDDPPSPHGHEGTNDGVWDLIMDKGTYDAIALMAKDAEGNPPVDGYPLRVARLLKPGGHFLITSCNFTETELHERFLTPVTDLQYHSRIQHQTYTFGGSTGSICSSVAFSKALASL